MSQPEHQPEAKREIFPDGSALVTYPDGSLLIVESDLAKATALREGGPVNYNDPPPPPAGSRRLTTFPLRSSGSGSCPFSAGHERGTRG